MCSKALLRHEPGADGGDDGGAVGAGVGGRQGEEGGGEDEGLEDEGHHHVMPSSHCNLYKSREWIPSWWKIEMRPWVPV